MSDLSIHEVTNKYNDSNNPYELVPTHIRIEDVKVISDDADNNNKSNKKENKVIINETDDNEMDFNNMACTVRETKVDMRLDDVAIYNRTELDQVMKAKLEEIIYQGEKSTLPVTPRRKIYVWFMNRDIEPNGDPLDYEPEERNGFILLVLGLVLVMLLCVFGFCCLVYFVPFLTDLFMRRGTRMLIMIAAMVIIFPMSCVMVCSSCSRRPPFNFFCLILITFAYSLLVALAVTFVPMTLVMTAVGITVAVMAVCSCLAMTSFDFTRLILLVIVASLVVMLCLLAIALLRMIFHIYFRPVHIAVLLVACLVACLSIIIELQMIIGGKSVELGTDDYALGAYMLFTSIISLFLNILQLLNILDF